MEAILLKALFKASNCNNSNLITSLLSAVANVFPVKMCTLWKVNFLTGHLSVHAREKYEPVSKLDFEYVHLIKGSLIGHFIDIIVSEKKKYIDIPSVLDQPYIDYHQSPDRVRSLKLKRMICIPIYDFDESKCEANRSNIGAILNIYPEDDFDFDLSYAEIIQEHFSLSISRSKLISREELTRDIMSVYENRGGRDLGTLFKPIIDKIFRKYIKYEGCSIFTWDPFSNKLDLVQTTGILGNPNTKDVYYYLGEGLTGGIALGEKEYIISDVNYYRKKNYDGNYKYKWRENTRNDPLSFMAIRIMSPSRVSEILGIIRFTNKLNPLANVIDQFNKDDYELINHASNMIALYMDYDQNSKIRSAFALQMAHEIKGPATFIRASSDRLQKRWNSSFSKRQVNSELRDIFDYSELQIILTSTIEYAWRGSEDIPKSNLYHVKRVRLLDLIEKVKKLAIPIAREQAIDFNSINIEGDLPYLFIDPTAFKQVFINLLTNAIKYRKRSRTERFKVSIKGYGLKEYQIPESNNIKVGYLRKNIRKVGYLINIIDFGIGVDPNEVNKIFNLGYRRKDVLRLDVRGLGMGLYVVKKVLEDFGCTIWVSKFSDPTIFSIFLPNTLRDDNYTKNSTWRD